MVEQKLLFTLAFTNSRIKLLGQKNRCVWGSMPPKNRVGRSATYFLCGFGQCFVAKLTLFCQIEKKVVESGQKRRVGRGAPNTPICYFLPYCGGSLLPGSFIVGVLYYGANSQQQKKVCLGLHDRPFFFGLTLQLFFSIWQKVSIFAVCFASTCSFFVWI
jgi:hypothetical protein